MELKESKRDIEKNTVELGEQRSILAKKTAELLFEQKHSFISQEVNEKIEHFFQDKAHVEELAVELEALQNRFEEEIEKQKTLNNEIKALSKDWNQSLLDFGTVLMEEYTPIFSDFLGDVYAEYEEQKKLIKNITQKIDEDRAEIEKMGFFSKILNQVKLSSTSANLTMQEKKLQKLFVEAGHIGVQISIFAEEDEGFSEQIFECYRKASQMQESINEKKVLLENAKNEEALVAQTIDAIGPNGSYQKKKNSLEKQGLEIENSINDEFRALGESFFEEKIANDAKKAPKKTEDLHDEVFALLTEAYEIQKKLIINRKKIEFLDLEADIAQKEKQKKHMQQNILQNEATIERLKEQNETLANTIVVASEEIDSLLRKKGALSKEIS